MTTPTQRHKGSDVIGISGRVIYLISTRHKISFRYICFLASLDYLIRRYDMSYCTSKMISSHLKVDITSVIRGFDFLKKRKLIKKAPDHVVTAYPREKPYILTTEGKLMISKMNERITKWLI